MGACLRAGFRIVLMPVILVLGFILILIGLLFRRREEELIQPESEEKQRLSLVEPIDEHDDLRRRWMIDMKPSERLDAIELAFNAQQMDVAPAVPFSVWAARQAKARGWNGGYSRARP